MDSLSAKRFHSKVNKFGRFLVYLFLFIGASNLIWLTVFDRKSGPTVIYVPAGAVVGQPGKLSGPLEPETTTDKKTTTTDQATTTATKQYPPELPIPAFQVLSEPRDYSMRSLHPSQDNMFFVETSCVFNNTPANYNNTGGLWLPLRAACSVYSAALMHPHRQVYIYHTCPISTDYYNSSEEWVKRVLELDNVNIIQIGSDLEGWFQGTPLEGFHTSLAKSKWKVSHSSDAFRFLTLWKYGGTYLDSDFIVTKPLDELGVNWAVASSNVYIACGLMNFHKGHQLVQRVLRLMKDRHKPEQWVSIGPELFTEVVNEKCNLTGRGKMVEGLGYMEHCDFTLYGHGVSYPIGYAGHRSMFEQNAWELIKEALARSHLVHFWNKLSVDKKIEEGSAYDRLATVFCHNVYAHRHP